MKFSLSSLLILVPLAFAAPSDVVKRADSLASRQGGRCIVANPALVPVPAGKPVQIQAQSHAHNLQRLTVSFSISAIPPVVFQGSGENVAMPIVGRNSNSTTIGSQSTGYNIILSFAYSTNGGTSFQVPTVLCPVMTPGDLFTTVTVVSEDARDNDDNDTLAEVSIVV